MNSVLEQTSKIKLGKWEFNIIGLNDMSMYSKFIKETQYPANLWSTNFAYLWALSQTPKQKVLWKIRPVD